VQWDVAVEFSILEGGFVTAPWQSLDTMSTARRVCARVPRDVPVGMHLCYGDNEHQHFVERSPVDPSTAGERRHEAAERG